MAAENSGWADGSGDLMTEAMRLPENDRVLDWHDELRRIEHEFADLPDEARAAVLRLVQLFQDEDGGASQDQAA